MNDHLASGDVEVQRSTIPATDEGVDITVAKMMEMARGPYGARSAKIRALAINIVNAAGVADKNYYGMAEAIHNWVRDTIRYVKDPVGQETLSFPEELAFNTKAGDCDDKTILEIALLGALGILAYPVVVAVGGPSYSHVYLHIALPRGKYPNAGKTIAADPIMREWPLGREAPADKVKRRKVFPHLLSGLGMLGSYAEGPSYLDEENTASIQPAMDRGFVSAGKDHTGPGGVQHFNVESEGLDAMFGGAPAERVLARGPITAGAAMNMTRGLKTRHKSVMAEGSFDARPEVSMVGSKDPLNVTDEELQVISQVIEEAASESAPYATVDGLGANDPLLKQAAVAHYADMKAARAAWQAARKGNKAWKTKRREDRAAAHKAKALANKAQALSNKANAFANRSAALNAKRQAALEKAKLLFAGTQGLLSDLADLNPSSEDLLVDTRRTVAGLAAALPGLAGAPGREDEQLARLGMAQSGNVLFGLSGDDVTSDNESVGVNDQDAPRGGIRRNGNRISAPKRIWKGIKRMLGVKRGRADAGEDQPERPARRRAPVRSRRRFQPPAFPKADESLLARPTDIPEGYSASGSAPPVETYGPDQMGPLERDASVLGPVEEPRTVDAEVVPADVETPAGTVDAAEDQPAQIEGLGQLSTTTKLGIGVGGLAVAGLIAYFIFRKK